MMTHAHLSFDGMRPIGPSQLSDSVTTRMRGVGKRECALESAESYRSLTNADQAIGRSSKDSKQDQAVERTGADIVKRGRRP
jgi:hypothetical protein